MAEGNSSGRVSRILGQYIVKYTFQFNLALKVFAVVAIVSIVLWLEASFAISKVIESGVVSNEDAVAQLRLVSSVIGKTGFLASALAFGYALVLSHFIAGPVYRFERTFKEIQDGKLGILVRLRGKDQFQDTAEKLNFSLSGLRNKVQKEREAINKIVDDSSKVLSDAGRGPEAEKLKNSIANIYSDPNGISINLQK